MGSRVLDNWAKGQQAMLESALIEDAERQELRAAGVARHTISRLYPFELTDYSKSLRQRLREPERLRSVTSNLVSATSRISTVVKLQGVLFPQQERDLDQLVNGLLDLILSVPKEDRPGHFIMRRGFEMEDMNAALALSEELAASLLFIHLCAVESESLRDATSKLNFAADVVQLENLVKHLTAEV